MDRRFRTWYRVEDGRVIGQYSDINNLLGGRRPDVYEIRFSPGPAGDLLHHDGVHFYSFDFTPREPDRVAKVRALAAGGATPGERAAAREALRRMGVDA